MGILDEAIRDHLELKRKGGAQEADLRQLEDEAFGPPSRPGEEAVPAEAPVGTSTAAPAKEPPAAPTEWGEAAVGEQDAEEAPEPGEETLFQDFAAQEGLVRPRGGPAPASPVEQEFNLNETEGEPESGEPSPPQPPPDAAKLHDTQPHDMESELGAVEGQPEPQQAEELEIDEDFELELDETELDPSSALEEPSEPESGRAEPPSDSGGTAEVVEEDEEVGEADVVEEDEEEGEDVLEETPEFLRETPEHDRLWFEQRPPKDFDFDE